MSDMTFSCPECGGMVEPVWAHYQAATPIAGMSASGTFRLPMHRCSNGHIHGWRPGEDFFIDLADGTEFLFSAALAGGTVAPQRRLLGSTRCGSCEQKLDLRATGQRLRGTLTARIDTVAHPAEFELDLPEVVCASCGARPPPDARGIRDTPADVQSWIFQLIADAMPPERATQIEQRT